MELDFIKDLSAVGVPVAIISAMVVTVIFKSINRRLSYISGVVTILIIVAYVPIELAPAAKDAFLPMKLFPSPKEIYAFDRNGQHINFTAACKSGRKDIDTFKSESTMPANWPNRSLSLRWLDDKHQYQVSFNEDKVGLISRNTLRNVGLSTVVSTSNNCKSNFIANSSRVYVGEQWEIGNVSPEIGDLTLYFESIEDGRAKIKLISNNLGSPRPNYLRLQNHTLDSETFSSQYDVVIQVRAADFRTSGQQWAAFTATAAIPR